jgi:hypothetical protein
VIVYLVRREEWGAVGGIGSRIGGGLKEVIGHHTASPGLSPDASIQEESSYILEQDIAHSRRPDGTKGIGYNWMIFPSGRVYEGRGWRRSGAHSPNKNSTTLGVAFEGTYSGRLPTDAAIQAFRELMEEGVRDGHLDTEYVIKGHRDYRATKCPGTALYEALYTLYPVAEEQEEAPPAPVEEPEELEPVEVPEETEAPPEAPATVQQSFFQRFKRFFERLF